jgi:hypothetical protein
MGLVWSVTAALSALVAMPSRSEPIDALSSLENVGMATRKSLLGAAFQGASRPVSPQPMDSEACGKAK